MCNLSEGIYEEGIEVGIERGTSLIIKKMLEKGRTPQEIHEFSGIPLETILNIQATTIVPQNK